jgi:hypothetical protein
VPKADKVHRSEQKRRIPKAIFRNIAARFSGPGFIITTRKIAARVSGADTGCATTIASISERSIRIGL